VSILLESLLVTFLSFILATYRYQDQDWTARPDGAITPWSYYCLGNWIALLNFCCILISGHINLRSCPETPIWLSSLVCLVAYYILPILYSPFSRHKDRLITVKPVLILDLKWLVSSLIISQFIRFSPPGNPQALTSHPKTSIWLSSSVYISAHHIIFILHARFSRHDGRLITAKSVLMSDLKWLASSLVIAQLIRFSPLENTQALWIIETLSQEIRDFRTLKTSVSATDFLISYLIHQPSRSSGGLKRLLLLLLATAMVALSLVNNPYLAPATGCHRAALKHLHTHACYSQISLSDPLSLQKQAFCYDTYKLRKDPQDIARYLVGKSTLIADSCSEKQLTSAWIASCMDLHSYFALHLNSGSGVSASPRKCFVILGLCLGNYRPREAARIPLFLQQDELKFFLNYSYFPLYPESRGSVI
jgi:hypothetical protein